MHMKYLFSTPIYRADCASLNLTNLKLTNDSANNLCDLSTNQHVGIYSATVAGTILMNFMRTIGFFCICVNASRVLHNQMFSSILQAPIRFFDITPTGHVQNLFSKDIGFLDGQLPLQFCEYMLVSGKPVSIHGFSLHALASLPHTTHKYTYPHAHTQLSIYLCYRGHKRQYNIVTSHCQVL